MSEQFYPQHTRSENRLNDHARTRAHTRSRSLRIRVTDLLHCIVAHGGIGAKGLLQGSRSVQVNLPSVLMRSVRNAMKCVTSRRTRARLHANIIHRSLLTRSDTVDDGRPLVEW